MQRELFDLSGQGIETTGTLDRSKNWFERFQITIRIDHLFIFAIVGLVFYVLVFSFGVEKGKRFALEELRAVKQKHRQMARELKELRSSTETGKGTEIERLTSPVLPPKGEEKKIPLENIQISQLGKPAGRYTIQLITYRDRSQAEKEAARIKKLGYQGFVIERGKFFEVCVEAFQNVREAGEKLAFLRREGSAPPDAYIRPLAASNL